MATRGFERAPAAPWWALESSRSPFSIGIGRMGRAPGGPRGSRYGARAHIARRPPPSRADTGADGHSACHPSRWDHARAVLLAPITAAQLNDSVIDTRERGRGAVLDARAPTARQDRTGERRDRGPRSGRSARDASPLARPGRGERGRRPGGRHRLCRSGASRRRDAGRGHQRGLRPRLPDHRSARPPRWPRRAAGQQRASDSPVARHCCRGLGAVRSSGNRSGFGRARPRCNRRSLRGARSAPDGGIGGIVQDVALVGLDRAACEFGSSREELAIALVDDDAATRYQDEHGVDPRSVGDLAQGALGF